MSPIRSERGYWTHRWPVIRSRRLPNYDGFEKRSDGGAGREARHLERSRAPDGQYYYVARVQLPSSRAETAQRHILEAEERVARDEFTAALNAYAQAAEANPDDASGLVGMAHMYTSLGRYREAIEIYQRVLGRDRPDEFFAVFLARAYVGAGDEANARNVLQAAGVDRPEQRIEALRQDVNVFGLALV